jgi:hypothetical protein
MNYDTKWASNRIAANRTAQDIPTHRHLVVLVFRTVMVQSPSLVHGHAAAFHDSVITDYYAFEDCDQGWDERREMLADLATETDPLRTQLARIPSYVTFVSEGRSLRPAEYQQLRDA